MGATSEMHIALQDRMMNMVHQAENGEISVLEALISLEEERKHLENSLNIVKSFKDDQLENIAYQAKEYPDGYNGYMVEVRNGGRMYSFKHIPEWQEHNKALKDCEDRCKQALISKEKGLLTATEDGEEVVLPEISYRKSSVVLKAKK